MKKPTKKQERIAHIATTLLMFSLKCDEICNKYMERYDEDLATVISNDPDFAARIMGDIKA